MTKSSSTAVSLCGLEIVAALVVLFLAQFQEVTSLVLPTSISTTHAHPIATFGTLCLQPTSCYIGSCVIDTFPVGVNRRKRSSARQIPAATSTIRLQASSFYTPLSKVVGAVSPTLRSCILLGVTAIAISTIIRGKGQQILYPGTSPDPKYSEPLPPGSLGCPFIGSNIFQNTNEGGPGEFFRRASAKFGNARIFKYMCLGIPFISVSGMKNIKQIFSTEFKSIQPRLIGTPGSSKLFGTESLVMCKTNDDHSFQRRLVGASLTPDAIERAIPSLQKSVTEQLDKIFDHPTTVMEHICTNFTLDVAWRQIPGLNLKEAEIPSFHQAVNDWVGGFFNFRALLLPGTQFTKPGRAYSRLVSLISKKIDELNRNGPDGSTLSAMVFAKDDINGKRLSPQQIIDN